MAFQPVGNAAETVIKAQLDGEDCFTVFSWLGSVGWGLADLQELSSDTEAAWSANMLPLLPSTYVGFEVVARGLRTASDFESTVPFSGTGIGTLIGSQLPNNVTIAVSHRTGQIGRSNRGRTYWPALVEGDVTGSRLSLLRSGDIVDAFDAFQTAVEASGLWLMGVASRWQNKVLRPQGVVIPFTSHTIRDLTTDSMRRRLPKRGS